MRSQVPNAALIGSAGGVIIPSGDEVTPRLLMLLEGECEGLGARRGRSQARSDQTAAPLPRLQLSRKATRGSQEQKRGPNQLHPYR